MRTGLLGKTLAHSISPLLHGLLGDENYRLFEIPEEDVGAFMTGGAWDAINVTIPYKKTVIPYCSSLSDRAAAIGSVNTVVRRPDGTLYGDNTDFAGFSDMARDVDFKGRKTVILGSGGASLTVQAAVKHLGASSVTVISRSGDDNYSNLSRHADADIIVNTTPVGMYPHEAESPISLDTFTSPSALLDLIYNPLRTRLVLEALERAIRPGAAMLDVGCGSGILSIASLLLGAEKAVGVDIDALAVKTALENGEENGFTPPRYTILQGDLVETVEGQYDVVAANIVADAIIALTPSIPRFLKPGGVYIVSGIIDTREADVLPVLEANGFTVTERLEHRGWLCFVLRRAGE